VGHAGAQRKDTAIDLPKVFFGGDAALGPKNIITAAAQGHEAAISIDLFCRGKESSTSGRRPSSTSSARRWASTSGATTTRSRRKSARRCRSRRWKRRSRTSSSNSKWVSIPSWPAPRPSAASTATSRRYFTVKTCIECDACVDICPTECITFTGNGEEDDLRGRLKAPAKNRDQALYVSDALKTGRVMVKDENICLHCGMCAERCPTGAWDMQKFFMQCAEAGTEAEKDMSAMKPIQSSNDFVIKFANVNGSGSASANELFARAIMRMGVPVAPRNIFPSNIQGMPTWYEMRVSAAGWLGRRGGCDLMVAMNPQTWDRDIAEIEAGGYLFYDSTKALPRSRFRDDITVLGIPLTEMCNREYTRRAAAPAVQEHHVRRCADGAARHRLRRGRKADRRPVSRQGQADRRQRQCPQARLRPRQGQFLPARSACASSAADGVGDKIFINGNDACGFGAVYGGATVAAWYPITPSTSVIEAFSSYCRKYRTDPDNGMARYAIVQAEDELASIGMVIGAAWNGARAFTATSGPGHFPDAGVFRPGLFCRGAGGDLRRAARRPIHRHADAHPAVGPDFLRLRIPRRYQACHAVSRRSLRMLHARARRPSIWPTGCRRRYSFCSTSISA
jgi:ferredoxin